MDSFDIFIFAFIVYGIYCCVNIKSDYLDYKKSKNYIEFNIYIRNVGIIIASFIALIYQINRLLN